MHWSVSRAWKPKISRSPRDATSTSLNFRPSGISSAGSRQVTGRLDPAISGTFWALARSTICWRLDPAVREVLVDEDRHRPARGPEDVEHLAEEPAARIELLELVVIGILAVLGDQQDGVDGQLARAQGQRVGDRRAEPDPVLLRLGPAQVGRRRGLLDEQAGDLERRPVEASGRAIIDREAVEEPPDDVIGVRQVVIHRCQRRRPWAGRGTGLRTQAPPPSPPAMPTAAPVISRK